MTLKILLADDHTIFREGLRKLLQSHPGMEIIGAAGDGRTAVELAKKLKPDIVVMDIGMPDLNGISATQQIHQGNPSSKVIALSMHSDWRFVSGMLQAGASGYLLKDCAFNELVTAIQAVAAGNFYLAPTMLNSVLDKFLSSASIPGQTPAHILSPREREILQLLSEGKTVKRIAHLLGISIKTVETHHNNIMKKLDIHSIAELTKFAIREGLTGLGG